MRRKAGTRVSAVRICSGTSTNLTSTRQVASTGTARQSHRFRIETVVSHNTSVGLAMYGAVPSDTKGACKPPMEEQFDVIGGKIPRQLTG